MDSTPLIVETASNDDVRPVLVAGDDSMLDGKNSFPPHELPGVGRCVDLHSGAGL